MQASSIVYVNVPHNAGDIAFGSSAACLGVLILGCYAIRPETPILAPAAEKRKDPDNDGSLTCKIL